MEVVRELMKGQPYSNRFKGKDKALRYSFPVYVESKVDDIRTHFIREGDKVRVLSYAKKPLYNLDLLCSELVQPMQKHGLTELDCGVQINGNFNDTYRLLRSSKGAPKDLKINVVRVYLFDVPDYAESPWEERVHIRNRLAAALHPSMCTPLHTLAHTEAGVLGAFSELRRRGYEGAMLKTLDGKYERRRGYSWFKIKPEETLDGRIVELHEAVCGTDHDGLRKGDPLGRIGSVTVEDEGGSKHTPHGIAHELGREMFLNPDKYLGEWIEFRRMEEDRQGGSRHPVFIRLREAKQ